ncbi:MAG: metal ABC transporter permease [Lachnospiraceae bacterium]|jgi:zinc transport system permease protein|nr:metal ABC transporter permease [Lachnospiraceae bacterium]MCR5466092.1 metal ABC transporter permease [Lachnospiraceae bacterium]
MDKIAYYLSFPFVRYAFLVGILVALCAALLGVILVLKRFSFIGDGLSHVAFGAIAIASVMKLTNNLVFVFPVTILAAVVLLKTGQSKRLHGDAAIAMISVGALALGYFLLCKRPNSTNVSGDVCSTLFGSQNMLSLQLNDVLLCLVMSLLVIGMFLLFYRKIFAVTFDENFARSTGLHVAAYNTMIAAVTAVVIVLAMNLVGSLLVSALIIFPALSSMRIFRSFRAVMLCSAGFAVFGAAAGILLSVVWSTPPGATIVIFDMGMFGLSALAGWLLGR